MSQPQPETVHANTLSSTTSLYLLPADSPEEQVRLQLQGERATRDLKWLFPPSVLLPEQKVSRILDVACATGNWVHSVAHTYADQVEVIGCDISPVLLNYATASALSQNIQNCSFDLVDMNQFPLPYADQSFQVINMRFAVGCLPRENWSPLIQELQRLLIPGGHLVLTEADTPMSTSPALNTLSKAVATTLWKKGFGFSETGETLHILTPLPQLIRDCGRYTSLEESPQLIRIAPDTGNYPDWMQDFTVLFRKIAPLMQSLGVLDEPEFQTLFSCLKDECEVESFQAFLPITVIVAQR